MRANLPPGLGRSARDPWPVYRTPWPVPGGRRPWSLVRAWWPPIRCAWPPIRGPWPPGARPVARVPGGRPRATWCAPWCAWCLVRGPRSVPPGGRSVAPGACALVAASRGACAWWRAPWCAAAGAWSGSPGPRRAAPGWGGRAQKTGRVAAGEGLGPVLRGQCCPEQFSCSPETRPLAKNSISACNFSWNKYNSFHENNVLEMRSAQRPPASAVLPRVPCCVRQGPSPTARRPAA